MANAKLSLIRTIQKVMFCEKHKKRIADVIVSGNIKEFEALHLELLEYMKNENNNCD